MKTDTFGDQGPAHILFAHYGDDWIRGSERCLLDLVTHLDRDKFIPVIWCNSRLMVAEAQKLGIQVYRSDFPLLFGWDTPRLDFKAFFALVKQGVKLVDKHSIKLIHANSGAPNQWLNMVARARRIPLLTHLHSRNALRDRLTLGLHQVAMAVGVSQPIIDQILDDGMLAKRTSVVANGIDTDLLDLQEPVDLRSMLGIKEDEFLIATVGSLIHRKGTDLIIDAVARLINEGRPMRLAIIGDGPEKQTLQQQIGNLKKQHQIHMLGERPDVAGLLRGGVNLFVSGAREEVFGLVLAEAGLAGLPVVAPDVGGIPGVVIDGKTGTLVPSENAAALASAINQLYINPQLRKTMGQNARQHILKKYTIKHNVQSFEALYNKLLSDPGSRMSWHSHWQLRIPFINGFKQIMNLTLARLFKVATP